MSSHSHRKRSQLTLGIFLLAALGPACLSSEEAPETEGALPDAPREVTAARQELTLAKLPRFPYLTYPIEIQSVSTGKCLQAGTSPLSGTATVQQVECGMGTDITWFLIQTNPNAYQ